PSWLVSSLLFMIPPPPRSTLFPYTTLFRSSPVRIQAIDLARGIAVTLMVLSHGVKGLLNFGQFTDWGLVPIHLITKFSSTLFFLDRKSTRLNSSHVKISYAVFCLKKKNKIE